jgi:F-type H+-transporting ATPase subunit b
MPQFDLALWPPQIVWLVICFVALYVIMARGALPRIAEILEEREFRINDSLRKAEGLRQDAEDAIAQYEQMMAEARTKAQEQVRSTRERAAREAAERHDELTQRLAREIQIAEAGIAQAREQAVARIRDMAVDVSGLAVERLIGVRPAADAVAGSVDKTLGETR